MMSTQHAYPKELIPYHGLIKGLQFSESSNLAVIRRVPAGSIISMGDGIFIIPREALLDGRAEIGRLLGMSMNLYSSCSGQEEIKFIQEKPAYSPWNKKNIDVSLYRKSLKYNNNMTSIVYSLNSLNDRRFEYKKTYKKFSQLEESDIEYVKNAEMAVLKQFSGTTEYKFDGNTLVSHEPSFMNYWHVELQVKLPEKKGVLKSSSAAWLESPLGWVYTNLLKSTFSLSCDGFDPFDMGRIYDPDVTKVERFWSKLRRNYISRNVVALEV